MSNGIEIGVIISVVGFAIMLWRTQADIKASIADKTEKDVQWRTRMELKLDELTRGNEGTNLQLGRLLEKTSDIEKRLTVVEKRTERHEGEMNELLKQKRSK